MYISKWFYGALLAALPVLAMCQTTDQTAENILVHQRNSGGWPKLPSGKTNYEKILSSTERNALLKDKSKEDATIDNNITTSEISHLLAAYKNTSNKSYLKAAEHGIEYLLAAQYSSGGWGQYYPDSSSYRKHITFNDNAMLNVLLLLDKVSDGTAPFDVFSETVKAQCKLAVEKGINCILNCQIKDKNGVLTVWCAQHDRNTFLPAPARSFELASYSGSESVGIVKFLMSVKNPSERIITAIESSIAWFKTHKIDGWAVESLLDTNGKIKDRVMLKDSSSVLWARFYDLETAKPIFVGRNGVPKSKLEEIELERRIGYSYLGTWPENLIKKDYPKWKEQWNK